MLMRFDNETKHAVLDVFLGVVGEIVSNLFNTFVIHCPYRIDLKKLIFWRSLRRSENLVLRTWLT